MLRADCGVSQIGSGDASNIIGWYIKIHTAILTAGESPTIKGPLLRFRLRAGRVRGLPPSTGKTIGTSWPSRIAEEFRRRFC